MDVNPYEPPRASLETPDVVMREQRDALAEAIRCRIEGKAIDDEVNDVVRRCGASPDSAVRSVYDTVMDYEEAYEMSRLEKPEWDHVQRLLLLLESDRSVFTTRRWRWSWSQLVPCCALLLLACCAVQVGWGYQLLLVTALFGVFTLVVGWLSPAADDVGPYESILSPFGTFADLRSTYDSVPTFRKQRHPNERGRAPDFFWKAVGAIVGWSLFLILSPLVLLFLAMPNSDVRRQVV